MKAKYIAIYDCNNGYTCSCCGREWEETEEDIWDDKECTEEDIVNYYKKSEYGDGEKTLRNVYKVEKELIS